MTLLLAFRRWAVFNKCEYSLHLSTSSLQLIFDRTSGDMFDESIDEANDKSY